MKQFLMLFLLGTFIAAIAAAPSHSAAAKEDLSELLDRLKKNTAPTKALLQALLKATSQEVFEQDDADDDGLKQDEDYNGIEQDEGDDGIEQDDDDDGALVAAVEKLDKKARAQFFFHLFRKLFHKIFG